jgi:hypothetical protein
MRKTNDATSGQGPQEAIEALIRTEAIRQGVPPHVALATAWVESRMQPNAEGDTRWHDNAERFRKSVPQDNPYRSIPKLWHAYGLFQLLAPYHVRGNESPLVLLDVPTNIERGVTRLRELLAISRDLDEVRLRYVGATKLSPERREPILHEWRNALQRYMVQEHVT